MKEIMLDKNCKENVLIINGEQYGYAQSTDDILIVKNMPRCKFVMSKNENNIGSMSVQSNHKIVVTVGETLDSICQKYNVSKEYLKSKNNMKGDTVFVGQLLEL